MHGIRKEKVSSKDMAKMQVQLEKYQVVLEKMYSIGKRLPEKGQLDFEFMGFKATNAVLQMNPDFSYCWDRRKSYFVHSKESVLAGDVEKELSLTKYCLMQNPKSYPTWYHRRYMVDQFTELVNVKHELLLCTQLLRLDERNFHCWNYRRWLASLLPDQACNEIAFSLEKIYDNFSNYSAFHHRSVYLKVNTEQIAREELDMIQQAAFTEPDDQSIWWYMLWIIQESLPFRKVLHDQFEWLETLVHMEPTAKWPKVLLWKLAKAMDHPDTLKHHENLLMQNPNAKYNPSMAPKNNSYI